ncbi:MAG: hypothetical protein EOP51_25315, partial [Sphingobacteriales bacterium]
MATITANLEATVNNQPTVSAVCEGDNAVLNINAIGGTGYTWTYPDGSTKIGKIQNLANITPTMAGIYNVVVQANSCTTAPQQVALKVKTKPVIDAISAQTACNGVVKTINFTGTASREYTSATTFTEINTVYSWTNDNPAIGLAASGTGNISFTPANTGNTSIIANIVVTAQGANGCNTTVTNFSITVNPDTKISLSSAVGTNAQEKCINEAITDIRYLISDGTATVTGLPIGLTGSFNAGVFTISGTATETGNFTYTVNATGNCLAATASGTIKINPNIEIALSSAITTAAQNVNINTAITNITYSLTNGATNATVTGLPAGVTGNFSAGKFTISGSPTVSGTYTYTVTGIGVCGNATLSGKITVNANAAIDLTSVAGTNSQSLCVSTPLVNVDYSITNGTNATITGLPAGVFGTYTMGNFKITGTPSVDGTFNYTITVTGPGAPATATGTIIVTPNTTIALTSATGTQQQAICVNNSIANITYAATNATNVTVTGLPTGITGAYSNGVFTISGTATVTGTFNYTVTANGSCTNVTSNGSITVNEFPSVNISSSTEQTSISKGDILTLTASGGTTYIWTGPEILTNNNSASINIRPKQTATYTVKATNASGCTTELSITVTVIEDRKLIPNNIITPNGDDKNDYWTIKNIDYYPNNKISVYDRAGRRVFFATSYQN